MHRCGPGWLLALALCLVSLPSAAAQSSPYGTSPYGTSAYDTSYLDPLPEASTDAPARQLTFQLALELPLPGPLLESGQPRMVGETVEIPVPGGAVLSGWTAGAQARRVPTGDAPGGSGEGARGKGWVETEDGKRRYSLLPSGVLLAQKRCRRCRAGWKTHWMLDVAGDDLAPPLITATRVFYGGLDNRVYGLKRRNGHRVWATDVEGRVNRPLRLWSRETDDRSVDLVLVTPDHGREILALDAGTGGKVAGFALPENGGILVGAPLITADGMVLAARQKYNESEASLMVLEITEPPAAEPQPNAPVESGL